MDVGGWGCGGVVVGMTSLPGVRARELFGEALLCGRSLQEDEQAREGAVATRVRVRVRVQCGACDL